MAIQLINFGEFHGILILKILWANGWLKIVVHVRETFSPDTPFLVFFFKLVWIGCNLWKYDIHDMCMT